MARSSLVRFGAGYRSYLLLLLAIAAAFNGADRQALGLVLPNIKATFHLSDTELGLLTGIAFALFYSVLGVPIGRWADSGNRISILALSCGLWSIMTALCATASSFAQLMLLRIGVGVGEAGLTPTAFSLIGDYFPRQERPKAVANYLVGGVASVLIGYFLAGWLNQLYGWRVMFEILGLPGVGLAILVALTLKEPRKAASAQKWPTNTSSYPGWRGLYEIARTLWAIKTFRRLLLSICVVFFLGNGVSQWQASFFVRSYRISSGALGTWFTVLYAGVGLFGTYWGGSVASRYAGGREQLQLRALAVLTGVFTVPAALGYLTHNFYLSLILLGIGASGGSLCTGPLFAAVQAVVPPRMRGVSIAVVFMFANLVGMGLGPLAVGALSDGLRGWLGAESLRYAIVAVCPGFFCSAWLMWLAARSVMRDIDAVPSESQTTGPGGGAELSPCGGDCSS